MDLFFLVLGIPFGTLAVIAALILIVMAGAGFAWAALRNAEGRDTEGRDQ